MGEPIRFGQNFGLGATGGFADQMVSQNTCRLQLENVSVL